MPLSFANENSFVKIIDFRGGTRFKNKLAGIGIFEGDTVKIIKNNFSGGVIIKKNDIKLAIGYGMANKILVQEL